MIHHFSIAAENPLRVTQVLTEILQGQPTRHPYKSGGYIIFTFDEYGTEIEIYPLGVEVAPGNNEELRAYLQNPDTSEFTATHAFISVPISAEQIEQIAAREGWLLQRSEFGLDYLMFWLENRILIELLPAEMSAQYMAFTQPGNLRQYFVFLDSQ